MFVLPVIGKNGSLNRCYKSHYWVAGGLQRGECIVWYEWAQGISLPQAHLQTNTMFYGTGCLPLCIFGCVIVQRLLDGSVEKA